MHGHLSSGGRILSGVHWKVKVMMSAAWPPDLPSPVHCILCPQKKNKQTFSFVFPTLSNVSPVQKKKQSKIRECQLALSRFRQIKTKKDTKWSKVHQKTTKWRFSSSLILISSISPVVIHLFLDSLSLYSTILWWLFDHKCLLRWNGVTTFVFCKLDWRYNTISETCYERRWKNTAVSTCGPRSVG